MTRDIHTIQTIDLALRSIAKKRSHLDAREARWLREAEACELWKPLGMVSMLDYMERTLGYTPRVALERLRVARELAHLPVLTAALAEGALSFSALREVTRVAVPTTEAEWCRDATGKTIRQVEELVASHARGDRPSDPARHEPRPRLVRFEVKAETFARLREARAALDAEHGERLDDDAFIAALCERALAPVVADEAQQGRAKFQVATIVCEECKRGWQSGGGATVSVGDAEVARAECDAQRIGSLEANEPARATQDVSPKVRRFVWRRDHGRCVVAGCRSARNLEIHHLKARADGGSHDASNLALLCGAHHAALHAGTLVLGAATKPARESRYDAAVMRVQAKSALVNMGWKAGIAAAAVDEALASLAPDGDIGGLIRAALRCCPV